MSKVSKPETLSPVGEAGRRHWNERWLLMRDNARGWRWMAFACLGLSAYCVHDRISHANESKVVPFVVQVNKLGEEVTAYRLEQSAPADPRVIKSYLARWVVDMRTVWADQEAQQGHFLRAFKFLDTGSQADQVFRDWLSSNAARESAKDFTVQVDVDAVSPEPGGTKSWRVTWSEQRSDLRGNRIGPPTYHYAVFGISINPPTTEAAIIDNPIGMFFETLEWGDRPAGRI